MSENERERLLDEAARVIAGAEALVITAGAGMGVDSGLPDFRGDKGFWKAYPPYEKLGLSFSSMANPRWFATDPAMAWGFYGHRLELYRKTRPHAGFGKLLQWGNSKPAGYFVFTSNVDGAFQRSGFDPARVVECHGAIDFAQCTADCGVGIFAADPFRVSVDEASFRAEAPLPACPSCGALARPNILMFGDGGWNDARTDEQERRLRAWLRGLSGRKVVIVECGAGTAVPSVRVFADRVVDDVGATLVRINVREPQVLEGHVGLAMGALEALSEIERRL